MDKAQTIVSGSRVHRPLLDYTVTDEDRKKAKRELNETEEQQKLSLQRFKEKLERETEFMPRVDNIYLLRFLRARKFDLDKAYKLMRDHYMFRAKHPRVFPAPSTIRTVLRQNIFNYLPHRDHLGRAIFLVKMANWNPSQVPYDEFVAAGNMLSEYVLDNEVTQINGYIGVWDFRGFGLKQFAPFISAQNVCLLTQLMQDRFPARFKIAYCVNCPSIVNIAWSIIQPILKDKFKSRVKILGSDMRDLHKYVDPSILPQEYGGKMPAGNCEDIVKLVLDSEQHFNYNRKFGYQVNQ